MRFVEDEPPPANDNAAPPVVRAARDRAHARYACHDGVILPLRFARRMAGWDDGGRGARKIVPRRR
jgi:hypothetical protein